MAGIIPPDVFQEYLENQHAQEARDRRMTARRILAEMVREIMSEGGLSWRRRRALVRFAGKYGIDEYEAGLLIRAAEYSFSNAPGTYQTGLAKEYLAELQPASWASTRRWMILAALLINTIGLIWLLHR